MAKTKQIRKLAKNESMYRDGFRYEVRDAGLIYFEKLSQAKFFAAGGQFAITVPKVVKS